jgi:long-chain acyl-CoA synthetase
MIEQICVYGSSYHDFVIAFVVPSQKQLKDLAASMKIEGEMEELCKNKELEKEIVKRMTEYGVKGKKEENYGFDCFFCFILFNVSKCQQYCRG